MEGDMIIYVEGICWPLQTSNEKHDIIEFQLHHQGYRILRAVR